MSGLYTHLRKHNLRMWRIFYRMNKRVDIQKSYHHVKVCDEWNIKVTPIESAFINFYDVMIDGYSDELEIDRIDPFGNYEPDNCRWVTPYVNRVNKRWHSTEYGKKYRQAIENGINRHTLYGRIRRGWNIDDAISMPISWEKYKSRKNK
jgi:hypothetical protein